MDIDKERIINYDFEGWPICKMNIREIIELFGGVLNESTGNYEIKNDAALDICPVILEEDGMGYGVNPRYLIEGGFATPEKEQFYMFSDVLLENIDAWTESGLVPGMVINIDGEKWMVHSYNPETKSFIVKQWNYSETDEKPSIQIGEEKELSEDEIKQYITNN